MKKIKPVLVILLFLVFVAGCNNKQETPDQVVQKALEAFKKLDMETVGKYFGYEVSSTMPGDVPQDDEVVKLMLKNLRCKVLSVDETGDCAIVKAEISNTSFADVFSEYLQKLFAMIGQAFSEDQSGWDEDQSTQVFIELLERKTNKIHTAVVEIKLNRSENNWVLDVEDNEDFHDAIWGGMITMFMGGDFF